MTREIVLDGLELELAIRSGFFAREEVFHHLDRQKRRGLLHGCQTFSRILAIGQHVAIGIACTRRLLRPREGFRHAPENINFAAGQQARVFSRHAEHSIILFQIRGVHQTLARFGKIQHLGQISGRLPTGFGSLTVGDGLARL